MVFGASLDNDVLLIFDSYGELRPSEVRERLLKISPYRDGETGHYDPRVFDVIIARSIKRLREKGYIKLVKGMHNLKIYALTENGEKKAGLISSTMGMNLSPQTVLEADVSAALRPKIGTTGLQNSEDLKTVKTLRNIHPEGKANVKALFWLKEKNLSESWSRPDLMGELNENLETAIGSFATRLVEELIERNIDARNARYKWKGWEKEPLEVKKIIAQEKAGLNFDVKVLLHFDGSRAAAEVDWAKEIAKAEEGDRLMAEGYKRFKEAVSAPGGEQRNWLTRKTIDTVKLVEHAPARGLADLPKLIAQVLNSSFEASDPWDVWGTPEKLAESFVRTIASSAAVTVEDLSQENLLELEAEVNRTIDELLKAGAIERVPVYMFKIRDHELANKMWRMAEAGYPSPYAPITNSSQNSPSAT